MTRKTRRKIQTRQKRITNFLLPKKAVRECSINMRPKKLLAVIRSASKLGKIGIFSVYSIPSLFIDSMIY